MTQMALKTGSLQDKPALCDELLAAESLKLWLDDLMSNVKSDPEQNQLRTALVFNHLSKTNQL